MKTTLNVKGRLYSLEKPLLMAILNLTPDSFYAGSRYQARDLLAKAEAMLQAGAAILDVGGYSTRPGADFVAEEEERRRVLPAIEQLQARFPEALISVDTFRAGIAQEAVSAGAGMVNDVSGGTLDAAMFETVATLQVPYILMHLKGTPQNMTQMNQYENIFVEIIDFFQKKNVSTQKFGLKRPYLRPGLGFCQGYSPKLPNFEVSVLFQGHRTPAFAGAFSQVYDIQNPGQKPRRSPQWQYRPTRLGTNARRFYTARTRCGRSPRNPAAL